MCVCSERPVPRGFVLCGHTFTHLSQLTGIKVIDRKLAYDAEKRLSSPTYHQA